MRRGRLYEATKASLPSSNTTETGVHLTQLISKSVKASIHALKNGCAMIASKVTPLVKEKGAEVDKAEGVGVVAIPDHLEHSCASLHLMVMASMAHITWKWLKTGKGTEKWRKILVIVERKMSLPWVTISRHTSIRERIKKKGKSMVIYPKKESKN